MHFWGATERQGCIYALVGGLENCTFKQTFFNVGFIQQDYLEGLFLCFNPSERSETDVQLTRL